MDKAEVLDIGFDIVDLENAVKAVTNMALSGEPHVVITANPEFVYSLHHTPRLRELLDRADMVVADGSGVVIASKLLGCPLPERVPGVDLVEGVLNTGQVSEVYLLGGKPGVAVEAGRNLQGRFPHVHLVGTHHGYFGIEEEATLIAEIAGSGAQLLLVGMGAPKQEMWLLEHKHELKVPVMIGVGGSLDVFAGRVKRAPGWAQRSHLEWLYRMVSEPKRFYRLPRLLWFAEQVLTSKITKSARS
ncbi:MAG TPA: WecB/TagA/CpsF family glycosyltransferase [Firmicutes bacterium]|nr:WecB/TagA/CpsF family glycosyltransferase [Bacillota bacterium]